MSDNTHPLIELLNLSNGIIFRQRSNYELFNTLKTALEEDGHAFVVRKEVDVLFPTALTGSSDLYSQEGLVLRSLIESWAQSVLAPMLERLNVYSMADEQLAIDMEGYLYDASLCFNCDLEAFVNQIDSSHLPAFKEVMEDWENTLNVITNSSELTDAFESVYK